MTSTSCSKKHTIVIEPKKCPIYSPTDTFQPARPKDFATRESRAAAAAEIARGQAVVSEILRQEAKTADANATNTTSLEADTKTPLREKSQ